MAVAEEAHAVFFGVPALAGSASGCGVPFRGRGLLLAPGGGGGGGHTPVAILESLVALRTVAAEPWRAPVARIQTMCMELGLQRDAPVPLGRWWEGPGLVLFVDGTHDGPSWRMGGFSEFLGERSYVARRLRAQGQQLVELHSLFWGVRLAVALGYATVTLVSDSEVAIAHFLQARAKSVLGAQQTVLRGLARSLVCSGLVVRVLSVCGCRRFSSPRTRCPGSRGTLEGIV